jgi:hypothetical protein
LNVIMDNRLWDRLSADVRLHVDGLILAGRKMAVIAAILDGAPGGYNQRTSGVQPVQSRGAVAAPETVQRGQTK